MADSLDELAKRLDAFAVERDWKQFHSPKNLASALVVESGELLEHFQWMTEEQSRQLETSQRQAVSAELADVLLYLIQLSSALGVDLIEAAHSKIDVNEMKYPADLARGRSDKYDAL